MKDVYNSQSPAQSVAPATRTSSTNGTGVDLQGFEGALILIEAGGWTDGSHVFQVQESDDNSTFTAVADADLQGTEPTIDSSEAGNQIYKLGYLGTKRYIRVVSTVTGTTNGAVYGASVIRGYARRKPVE